MRTLDEERLEAATRGSAQEIEDLVNRGANIHARNADGRTPLHLVAENNHLAAAQKLLQLKATVDATMNDEGTPLLDAVSGGHHDMATLLLSAGANPLLTDRDGCGLLHWAIDENRLATIEWVIRQFPALFTHIQHQQDSPLHYAIRRGHVAAVKLLIRLGADIYYSDKDKTAIQMAREVGNDEITQYLQQKIIHRAERTQSKFFNLGRVRQGRDQTRQLAGQYLHFRRTAAEKDNPINANGIPARRLVTADAGAVEISLRELRREQLSDMNAVSTKVAGLN